MTRERINDFKKIVLPSISKLLLDVNYEGQGKCDAEEFAKDFNEILDLATKALEQEPCDDCVSRQAVLDEVRAIATWHSGDAFNEDRVITHMKMLPSVPPKREQGEWVEYNYKVGDHSCDFWGIYCNRCLKKYTTFHSLKNPNYCPNCGAKMR